MLPREVWKDSSLGSLREQVDRFVGSLLDDYNAFLKNTPHLLDKKQPTTIYDIVWGNITFNPAEMVLIDSPLIQRLRKIKQLGVSYLVYPSASHTRFDHTLGVMHVAGEFAKRIAGIAINHSPARYSELPTLDIVDVVKLAALFHDAGHILFSHIGERYFESESFSAHRVFDQCKRQFAYKIKAGSVKSGELLSALILTAPATIELLSLIRPLYKSGAPVQSNDDAVKTASLAACFILGLPVCASLVPFSKILTGSVDADKCDYLSRDSRHTGIPVPLDASRIVQKLTVGNQIVKERTAVWADDGSKQTSVLAMEYSSMRNIEDVALSRSLMYEKVYSHQKVLAAEAVFFRAMRLMDVSCPGFFSSFSHILDLTDAEAVCADPKVTLAARIKKHGLNITDQNNFDHACELFHDIHNRKLPGRSCVFTDNDFLPGSDNKNELLSSVFDVQGCAGAESFCQDVVGVAQKLATILQKHTDDVDCCYLKPSNISVYIGSQQETSTSHVDFPLKTATGVKPYERIFTYGLWQSSHSSIISRKRYVFSGKEYATLVYLATEIVIYKKHRLRFSADVADSSKLDRDVYKKYYRYLVNGTDKLDDDLTQCIDVLYKIESLDNEALHDRIRAVSADWNQYAGDGLGKFPVQRLYEYLAQFLPYRNGISVEDFLDVLVAVLENVKFLSRANIVEHFKTLFTEIAAKETKTPQNYWNIVSLGGPYDSASHISYYFNDLFSKEEPKPQILMMKDLAGKLAGGASSAPFVFYDDAYFSGMQLVCLFQELMGIPIEERCIHEDHGITPLKSEGKENLKASKIYLAHCYYNDNTEVQTFIKRELNALGFKELTIVGSQPFPTAVFASKNDEIWSRVQEAFVAVGKELLQEKKKKGWTDADIAKHSLGYNDAQQCLVLPWNTPTYTLTALWRSGTVGGAQWLPLFPRQSK